MSKSVKTGFRAAPRRKPPTSGQARAADASRSARCGGFGAAANPQGESTRSMARAPPSSTRSRRGPARRAPWWREACPRSPRPCIRPPAPRRVPPPRPPGVVLPSASPLVLHRRGPARFQHPERDERRPRGLRDSRARAATDGLGTRSSMRRRGGIRTLERPVTSNGFRDRSECADLQVLLLSCRGAVCSVSRRWDSPRRAPASAHASDPPPVRAAIADGPTRPGQTQRPSDWLSYLLAHVASVCRGRTKGTRRPTSRWCAPPSRETPSERLRLRSLGPFLRLG